METSKSLKVLNVLVQLCVKNSACVFFSLTGANMFCMIPCSSASEPKKVRCLLFRFSTCCMQCFIEPLQIL